jgi:hypothetical protein
MIHNGGFKKTRYTTEDYANYVKLMKYRYGPDTPIEDVGRLIFPRKSFDYTTQSQFDLQPFNGPQPIRKSIDEKSGFVNEFCIGMNNKPIIDKVMQ